MCLLETRLLVMCLLSYVYIRNGFVRNVLVGNASVCNMTVINKSIWNESATIKPIKKTLSFGNMPVTKMSWYHFKRRNNFAPVFTIMTWPIKLRSDLFLPRKKTTKKSFQFWSIWDQNVSREFRLDLGSGSLVSWKKWGRKRGVERERECVCACVHIHVYVCECGCVSLCESERERKRKGKKHS